MKSNKIINECLRIVVLGNTGVGKSALVVRYLTKRFIWEYDPTLECVYKHQTNVDNESTAIELLDTAGENNSNVSSNFEGNAMWGDGFIVVYSVVDRNSFEQISSIKSQLDEIRKSSSVCSVPCVLVGNKVDLEHQRTVSFDEGEQLAARLSCSFFETSASDGGAVIAEAFHEICREVKRRRNGPAVNNEKYPRRRTSAHQQVMHVINRVLTKING